MATSTHTLEGFTPSGSASVVLPERPNRASDVQLVGELQGSGFAERQWLVSRGGRYLQVTELLYKLLESLDGVRTYQQLAEQLSGSTRWLVTPDDVRMLVERKLAPSGLVAGAPEPRRAHGRSSPLGPLGLTARVKVIGPAVIDPITSVLRHLFRPPLVMLLLAAGVAAEIWLYTSHVLFAALLDALYTPGFLLIVVGLVVAGAVVHEFGHAAALRYGGGHVRGMGAGLYLVFPAFYTDVTDSYRLGRWARVRTGLGGVYFHLLYALLLTGIAVLFDVKFLLLVVFLINLEIVRQFVPFVRLDGYWVLADLTGVPDFFSQVAPFLRRRLRAGTTQPRLPRLKRWAEAVFGLYLLVTVPALLAGLYFVLRRAPRILTTIWDALATQANLLAAAWSADDALGTATAAVQLLVLGLSGLGIGYLLYSLFVKPARAAAQARSAVRRVGGSAAVLGAAAGLGLLWAPELPFARTAAPAGVQTFAVPSHREVQTSVRYSQAPPVGGDHSPVWQNCGFYSAPIGDEHGVGSLARGAVWITYQPGLDGRQLAILRRLARRDHVLVTPHRRLPAPVVASAWGRQLRLGAALDARLERFVRAYRLDAQAPETGRPCTGGKGEPR